MVILYTATELFSGYVVYILVSSLEKVELYVLYAPSLRRSVSKLVILISADTLVTTSPVILRVVFKAEYPIEIVTILRIMAKLISIHFVKLLFNICFMISPPFYISLFYIIIT